MTISMLLNRKQGYAYSGQKGAQTMTRKEIEDRIAVLENQQQMIYFNHMGSREWDLLRKCEKELEELKAELKGAES